MIDHIINYININKKELIELLQEMVRIPSTTYNEGQIAEFVKKELTDIGMDTYTDLLGDVTGILKGQKEDPVFLLNTHLDHAEPGDMTDPYSGKIMDGGEFGVQGEVVYGRGVNGQKASLAGMIFAVKAIIDSGITLKRGIAINSVVMEECGGHLGPKYLMGHDKLPVYWVLCGEHTNLKPIFGNRGMINMQLCIEGKGSHAAAPEDSSSALTGMARVIIALEKLKNEFPIDKNFGKTLVSLNRLFVMPNVANVIPDKCKAVIDVRNPASLSREEIVTKINSCIANAVRSQKDLKYRVGIEKYKVKSYTGVEELIDGCLFPCFTPPDHPLVDCLVKAIEKVLGFTPEPGIWTISSETGYFSNVLGLPVVAFGPGEDRFTHTRYEHVKVEDLINAAKVYAAVIDKVCLNEDL